MRIETTADAITAGRLGLWLLGRRASAAKQARVAQPRREPRGLAARVGYALAPWRVREYPGTEALLASICGVSRETAKGWLRGNRPSARSRERLAQYLEDGAAILQSLALELRRDVAAPKKPRDNFNKRENASTAEIITSDAKEQAPVIAKSKPANPRKKSAPKIFGDTPSGPRKRSDRTSPK